MWSSSEKDGFKDLSLQLLDIPKPKVYFTVLNPSVFKTPVYDIFIVISRSKELHQPLHVSNSRKLAYYMFSM